MLIKKEVPLCSLTGLAQLCGTACLYFLLLEIVNHYIATSTGVELRFATVVPVVAGLLFGLPGAVGAFCGNFVAGLYTGYGLSSNFVASFLNFLLAYTPFRLWYGWQSKKATLYVYNNRTFVKFVRITLLSGGSFALLWSAFQQFFFGNTSPDVAVFTFVNNFAFPALLGLPVLLLWDKYATTEFVRPQDEVHYWHALCPYAFWLLLLFDAASFFFTFYGFTSPEMAFFIGVAGVLSWLLAIQVPSEYSTHPEETDGFQSLEASATIRLFLGVTCLIVLFLLLSIYLKGYDIATWQSYANWLDFSKKILLCLALLITGSYFVLLVLERTMTQRLKLLSDRVKGYLATRDLSKLQMSAVPLGQQNEIDVLEQTLHKMSGDITTYLNNLDETVAEQEAINAQLNVANNIQHSVLPKLELLRPVLPGYQIDGGMNAAKVIGGDMYDAFLVDADHLAIYIADVSGKGVPAALFAMVTSALLRQNAIKFPPAQALQLTNDALCLHNEQCLFVTVWFAVLELSTGHLEYINAGHNPPLLHLPGAAKAVWLEELSGPVLGLMPNLEYTVHTAELPQDARLLLYTDGLNEAENTAHEFFGNERLEESFMQAVEPQSILTAIHDFTAGAEQSDDMTYLWLAREEEKK